jgi:hypothetical protein
LEARAVTGVAQLRLRVVEYVLARPAGTLVAAEEQLQFRGAESASRDMVKTWLNS